MKFSDINLNALGNTIQLIGTIYAGEGNTYLIMLPEESTIGPTHEIAMSPEDWKACLAQTDSIVVEVIDGTRKAMVRKCERNVDSVIAWRVYQRDHFTCRYCARTDVPLTVDHLILWEEGGPTIPENLISACKKCNRTRGNMQYGDWIQSNTYLKLGKNLSNGVKAANAALVSTLTSIKRVNNIRTR